MADLQSAALATWLRRPVFVHNGRIGPVGERWNPTGGADFGQGVWRAVEKRGHRGYDASFACPPYTMFSLPWKRNQVQMSDTKRKTDSEEQLVARAQEAVSHCRWVVGECAATWTARYARGRTDGDFAVLIGISGDQVYQRRRVWETFGEIRNLYPSLKWSHFYAGLTWEDARDCLSWAEETHSTVAEMRAWRRAQRGEDLSVDSGEEETVQYIPSQTEYVQDPTGFGGEGPRGEEPRSHGNGAESDRAVLAGVARQAGTGEEAYTPFKTGATSPAPQGGMADRPTAPAEPLTTEQLAKRFTNTVERFVKLMTPEFRREFRSLPAPVKEKFLSAVSELRERVAELK